MSLAFPTGLASSLWDPSLPFTPLLCFWGCSCASLWKLGTFDQSGALLCLLLSEMLTPSFDDTDLPSAGHHTDALLG